LDFFEPESLAILLVVAAVTSIVFVVWYLVSTIALAPEFLAELLLDGVFSAALYRALNRTERRHWRKTVFARTRAPFLSCGLSRFSCSWALSHNDAPEAISIAGVIRHIARR